MNFTNISNLVALLKRRKEFVIQMGGLHDLVILDFGGSRVLIFHRIGSKSKATLGCLFCIGYVNNEFPCRFHFRNGHCKILLMLMILHCLPSNAIFIDNSFYQFCFNKLDKFITYPSSEKY